MICAGRTSKLEEKIIRKAFNYVDKCEGKSRHISFIVRRNKILAVGWNRDTRTLALARRFRYWQASIHSEIACIANFPHSIAELRYCEMWNVRIDRHNQIRISKPCQRCRKVINAFDLAGVYYTTDEGDFYYE